MYKKPLIVFEGIEGSGKTLHSNNLAKFLRKKKIPFIKFREPGGTKNSEKLRRVILNKKNKFNKNTDLLLYLAARSENYHKLLAKNFGKKIIIIDRFIDSTIAYQHYGMGISLKLIKIINKFVIGNIKADMTFLHIVKLSEMKKRLMNRKVINRYDKFKNKFYNRVQNGFIKISKTNKKKYFLINSENDVLHNKKKIIKHVKKLIYSKWITLIKSNYMVIQIICLI